MAATRWLLILVFTLRFEVSEFNHKVCLYKNSKTATKKMIYFP